MQLYIMTVRAVLPAYKLFDS